METNQISIRLTVDGEKSELVNFLRNLANEIEVREDLPEVYETSGGYAEIYEE